MASAAPVLRQEAQTIEGGTMPRSLFGRPSNRVYKAAVAEIIREAKAKHKLSNERLAELIGCSETTVFNAENEACDLAAVTLLSIAYAFGEDAIAPVRNLYLCAPADQPTKDGLIRRAIGLLNQAEGME